MAPIRLSSPPKNRLTESKGRAIRPGGTVWAIVAKRDGRALKPIGQRSPVKKASDFFSVGAAALQRAGSLTGPTRRITRVHESCYCSARESPVGSEERQEGNGCVST